MSRLKVPRVIARLTNLSPMWAPVVLGLTLPLVAYAILGPEAGAPEQATTSTVGARNAGHAPASDDAQARWLACIEPLLDARDQRVAEGTACLERIFDAGQNLITDKGVDAFVEEAVSLVSTTKQATDYAGWNRWLAERFREEVFPVEHFCDFVDGQLQQLSAAFAAIDSATIVQLGGDFEFASPQPLAQPADRTAIRQAADQAVAAILPAVKTALGQSFGSAAAGTLTGAAGHQAARDYLRDDEGEVSLLGEFAAFVAGIVVEEGVSAAVDYMADTRPALRDSIIQASGDLRWACVVQGPAVSARVDLLVEALRQHEQALALAFIDELGVERSWAFDVYNAAVRQRAEARQ